MDAKRRRVSAFGVGDAIPIIPSPSTSAFTSDSEGTREGEAEAHDTVGMWEEDGDADGEEGHLQPAFYAESPRLWRKRVLTSSDLVVQTLPLSVTRAHQQPSSVRKASMQLASDKSKATTPSWLRARRRSDELEEKQLECTETHVRGDKLHLPYAIRQAPMHPQELLRNLLSARGHTCTIVRSIDYCTNRCPTEQQMRDYDMPLLAAVRTSDLSSLKRFHAEGRSMIACNKFSESIMHLACRRSSYEIIEFMLHNGATTSICDDYGRTPLHDAFWRAEPHFEIVKLLLDHDLNALHLQDARGATPLTYVRTEHWLQWCAFIVHHRERYWQSIPH